MEDQSNLADLGSVALAEVVIGSLDSSYFYFLDIATTFLNTDLVKSWFAGLLFAW